MEQEKKIIIKVQNLFKSYGNIEAVKGVSFNVFEGEIFGLLGPNGAGKTTTLEIMETLREKTSGDIWINGFNVDTDQNQIKQNIGVQLQESGFYPNLKLVEMLELFAGLYNVDIDPVHLLTKMGLQEKAHTRVDKLSGGQKQRFSIATTLVNNPKLVFLDEPTVGLDPQARRNLWELIREIQKCGTTVVLTTHYLDEAEFLCDRVGIMDEGQIIRIDSPDEMIHDLIRSGFKRHKAMKEASLEDVFLELTGKKLRED
ncbi:ABC transporter ATP-binding protein [bacterium]|nr:MAG: ABC transporter ATP-binding protein [bacterium]